VVRTQNILCIKIPNKKKIAKVGKKGRLKYHDINQAKNIVAPTSNTAI